MGIKSRIKRERRLAGIATQADAQPTQDNSQSLDQKVLVLVTGLPYSGKTTFAGYLSQTRGYQHVEHDALFNRYMRDVVRSPEFHLALQQSGLPQEMIQGKEQAFLMEWYVNYLIKLLSKNEGVVADTADLLSPRNRSYFLQLVKERTPSATEIYWMDTNLDTCLQRYREDRKAPQSVVGNKPREVITKDLLVEWSRIAIPPKLEEGFNKIFYVKGISPTEYQIVEQTPKPIR